METGAPNPGHAASELGTELHGYVAAVLAQKMTVLDALKAAGDEDYAVQTCLNFVRQLRADFPAMQLCVEQEFEMPFLGEGEKGTLDLAVVDPFVSGIVVDFKFTHIDPPTADRNRQLLAYAIALMDKFELQEVKVAIVLAFRGWASRFTFTREMLENGRRLLGQITGATKLSIAPLIPSTDACRYCTAATFCPANLALLAAIEAKAALHVDVSKLPAAELGRIAREMKPLQGFANQITNQLFQIITAGAQVDGWEVSPSRGRRVWQEYVTKELLAMKADELAKAVNEKGKPAVKRELPVTNLTVEKLVSPAQLEEQWGTSKPVKEAITALAYVKPGELALRPKEVEVDSGY